MRKGMEDLRAFVAEHSGKDEGLPGDVYARLLGTFVNPADGRPLSQGDVLAAGGGGVLLHACAAMRPLLERAGAGLDDRDPEQRLIGLVAGLRELAGPGAMDPTPAPDLGGSPGGSPPAAGEARGGGGGGGPSGRRVGPSGAASRPKTAGVGYAGDTRDTQLMVAWRKKQSAEREAEERMSEVVKQVNDALSEVAWRHDEAPRWDCSEVELPLPPFAALLCGGLPRLLSGLFSRSLQSISESMPLLRKSLAFMRLCTSHRCLLPLVALPVEALLCLPGAREAAVPAPDLAPSAMSRLHERAQQAQVAQRMAIGDSAEEVNTRACAVDILTSFNESNLAVAQWSAAHLGPFLAQLQAYASSGGRDWGLSAPGPAPAPAPSPGPAAPGALHQRYQAEMGQFRLVEAPLAATHYFRGEAGQGLGGEQMRRWNKRVQTEIASLATNLPVAFDSAILLAFDPARLHLMRAVIFPSPDTPYGHGPFEFDILFPDAYPARPPKFQFLTTAGGRVRFNPNLYNNGKVCLSLLGTWSGPSWEPGVSTLEQVLVSVQSMVLCETPWLNEPGHMSDPQSMRLYDNQLRRAPADGRRAPLPRPPLAPPRPPVTPPGPAPSPQVPHNGVRDPAPPFRGVAPSLWGGHPHPPLPEAGRHPRHARGVEAGGAGALRAPEGPRPAVPAHALLPLRHPRRRGGAGGAAAAAREDGGEGADDAGGGEGRGGGGEGRGGGGARGGRHGGRGGCRGRRGGGRRGGGA